MGGRPRSVDRQSRCGKLDDVGRPMRRPVDGRPARLTALVLRQAGRTERRFPPPWSVEETDACFIVKDGTGQSLAYVYLRG